MSNQQHSTSPGRMALIGLLVIGFMAVAITLSVMLSLAIRPEVTCV